MGKTPGFDWKLWLQWVLATALGWLIGGAFLPLEVAAGLTMGLTQWLILRPRFPGAGWWIPISAAGWMLGWGAAIALLPPTAAPLAAALVGLALGSAQWVALRRWAPLAGWWIVVNALAWLLALGGFSSPPLAGLTAGVVTGIAIELLARYTK